MWSESTPQNPSSLRTGPAWRRLPRCMQRSVPAAGGPCWLVPLPFYILAGFGTAAPSRVGTAVLTSPVMIWVCLFFPSVVSALLCSELLSSRRQDGFRPPTEPAGGGLGLCLGHRRRGSLGVHSFCPSASCPGESRHMQVSTRGHGPHNPTVLRQHKTEATKGKKIQKNTDRNAHGCPQKTQ